VTEDLNRRLMSETKRKTISTQGKRKPLVEWERTQYTLTGKFFGRNENKETKVGEGGKRVRIPGNNKDQCYTSVTEGDVEVS